VTARFRGTAALAMMAIFFFRGPLLLAVSPESASRPSPPSNSSSADAPPSPSGTTSSAGATSPSDPDKARREEYEKLFGMPLKRPDISMWNTASRRVVAAARAREMQLTGVKSACPSLTQASRAGGPAIRACEAQAYDASASYRELRREYPVRSTDEVIGGVSTEIFVPADGVAPANQHRVLIDLHGGSFLYGARTESRLTSIPIASIGRIKVISVDYREAPEHAFPAATDDVIAVYRELLKSYAPKNIGVYGCSTGALLAAEATAWLVKHKMPLPGALGLFCEGAGYWEGGGAPIHAADDFIWRAPAENPYFSRTSAADPLAFPLRSTTLLAGFPPALLLTASKDPALPAAVDLQAALVRLGVHAELHVFEGLGREFFFDPASPSARDVYAAAAKFFDAELGR
jgi:epsilon-lactone hydrolase